jgi:putative colanic acid biosynthesis UDP-glucose lipid carrier transferase
MADVILGSLISGEFVVVIVSAIIAHWVRYQSVHLPATYWFAALLGGTLHINGLIATRIYSLVERPQPPYRLGGLITGWGAVILLMAVIMYFGKMSDDVSRTWLALWFFIAAGGLVGMRLTAVAVLRRWNRQGRLSVGVALIATGRMLDCLATRLAMSGNRYQVVATFRVHSGRSAQSAELESVIGEVYRLVQSQGVDEVIIAIPRMVPDALDALVQRLGMMPVTVRVCPSTLGGGNLTLVAGMPMYSVVHRPLSGWDRVVKRAEDVILSSMLLVLLLPLMIVIATAIRLDSPGPVLFRQSRFGFRNNPIRVYKFRSMHLACCADTTAPQAVRRDPRVTRVGRFIRATSLDELPQLLNVLKGEMSLVGPRPHPVALNERFAVTIHNYMARHRVRPGITGWAQVNGLRGETDTVEKMRMRVEHDLYYIENWSLILDSKILLTTAMKGLVGKNAF